MGKNHFNKGDTRWHMKKCSASLTTKEMQIKTTLRYLSNQLKLKRNMATPNAGKILKKKKKRKKMNYTYTFGRNLKLYSHSGKTTLS